MNNNNPPSSLNTPPPQNAALHINAMKALLLERLWTGLLVLALLGAPASLMRIATTGWQSTYIVHLGAAAFVFIVTWLRWRMPDAVKASIIMATLAVISVPGLVNFGLMSQGGGLLIVFMILSSMLFSKRTALLISTGFGAVMLAIGIGFITGRLQVSFDANVYMQSISGWTFLFLGATLFGAFVAIGVLVQRDFIHQLLVENELQHQRIVHQATHDSLTQLPTLRLAMDRLQMAIHAARRSGQEVALMFVDLDGFKQVNDTYGHAAGDSILQQVAERLSNVVRPSDTVARVGGDEFLVILGQQTNRDHASDTARRIIGSLAPAFTYQGHDIFIGCSVGISLCPEHADDPDDMKRAADEAMYQVKKAGKNNFVFAAQPVN